MSSDATVAKSIFEEAISNHDCKTKAESADIIHILELSLASTFYKTWSNLVLISALVDHYCFLDLSSTIPKLITILNDLWVKKNNQKDLSTSVKKRIEKLKNIAANVAESGPAKNIILKNILEIFENNATTDIQIRLTNQITQIKRKSPEERTTSMNDELQIVFDKYVEKYVLDFRKIKVARKYKKVVEQFLDISKLRFVYSIKEDERALLNKIGEAQDIHELYKSIQDVSILEDSKETAFISLAVQKMIMLWRAKQLEKTTHNEDWFRINVYSDLYDNLFNLQENWTTKRSECHSLAWKRIKELRDKNIKLDFILAFGSNNGLDEIFFTEDKSSNKNPSKKERRKSDFVRVKMLDYWSTVLPYKECLNYLECCSSHFNGLKLQIMCTKIYNDITIHYLKREVHVPNNSNNNSSLSVYLATVLSLMRTIQINLKKAQAMLEIYEIDNISFLSSAPSTSVEYDSDSQSSSPQSLGWEEEETKRRILEKIQIKMKEIEESDRENFMEIVWEVLAF